jgi:hypothetical protein
MAMFASVDDLADYLQTEFDEDDRVRATRLLESASSVIQRHARQTITLATSTVTLLPTGTNLLMLPELPVIDVTSITDGGSTVDPDSYLATSSGLLYAMPPTTKWKNVVVVTYDHGYDPIPDDIAAVIIDMSARAWNNPRGVLSEQIGTYSARYPNNRTGLSLLPDEEQLVASYRPVPG